MGELDQNVKMWQQYSERFLGCKRYYRPCEETFSLLVIGPVTYRHVNHICKEIVDIILKVINGHQIIKCEVKIPEDLRNGGERHYASRLHQPPQCFRDEFYN